MDKVGGSGKPVVDEDDLAYQYRGDKPKNFPGLASKVGLLGHLRFTHRDIRMSQSATMEAVKAHHVKLHVAGGALAVHTHKARLSPK